jgi:histidine phosphotransferase ChpT
VSTLFGKDLAAMPDLAHDLASLMCSKLCHDLVSPIGALGNGIEVLADESDAALREDALDLIAQSARAAAAKLQFARLAFGSAGGAGGTLDLASAARAAQDYFATTKASLEWEPAARTVPKDAARLCLNLLLVALEAIPRGGELRATLDLDAEGHGDFRVEATGRGARMPDRTWAAILGQTLEDELDARLVQPFFTGHLARCIGAELAYETDQASVKVSARV